MEKSITVEQYHFNYYSLGRSSHPPILFLHGFMGDCREFNEVMSLLSNQFYCLAVDLPGHGKSQTSDDDQDYIMQKTANGLIRFLDALDIKNSFLLGYSMGGRLALYLTLHFPNYFSKVVLESASPGLKTQAERIKRIESDRTLAQELETEEFSAFLAKWYNQPLFASLKKHPAFEKLLKSRLQNHPFNLAKSLRYLSTGCQPSLWKKLEQNTISILLLVGEFDTKFVNINSEMASLCKSATLEIVDQCGHTIHFEQVNRFIAKTRDFLSK
ncbi:MAG: 2-succinyl-6-hydroxy-2,4-cyclohexadiene-1-carboxylate synthase [Cyanobacteria bacterium RU_5_0]|nr:2-succinyl-6-hydroxy-2,4-cyclohexadiene-1-carboxylate synthase [Cyanobacteria bacterium RU_5_0]